MEPVNRRFGDSIRSPSLSSCSVIIVHFVHLNRVHFVHIGRFIYEKKEILPLFFSGSIFTLILKALTIGVRLLHAGLPD